MKRRVTVVFLTLIVALIMGQISVQTVDAESSGTYRGISYTITDDNKLQLGAPGVTQEMTAENTPFRPENKSKFDEVEFLGKIKANGSISGLFGGAGKITNIGYLDTAGVTDMSSLFVGCTGLQSLDVSHFNTANVTNMSGMFGGHAVNDGCSGLTSLDLTSFDTGKVTNMSEMFDGCTGLQSLDVSSFDTGNVTYATGMFEGCSSLTSLDVSGFDMSKVEYANQMFDGCKNLRSLDVSGFATASATDMKYMFCGCSSLQSLDVSGFDTARVTGMVYMFSGCSGLKSLDVSGFDTGNVTNMQGMFSGCSGLKSLDVSGFDTGSVTNMAAVFSGCSGLQSLDVSGFDTSKATWTWSMFEGCSGLTSLDVSSFDTHNVSNMGDMFKDCSGLTSLDISNFDFSSAWKTAGMFSGCTGLTSLDLSNFDATTVSWSEGLLSGDANIAAIYLGEKFAFKQAPKEDLPAPPAGAEYTGKWINAGKQTFTAEELMTSYDGSSMAGKYIWEPAVRVKLEEAIRRAGAIEKGNYADASYNRMRQAAENAAVVLEPFDAPRDKLQRALDELNTAINNLTGKPVAVELMRGTSSGKKAVKLRWTAVNGASSYAVYGSLCKKGSFKKIKTLGAGTTSFKVKKLGKKKLKPHKDYKFYVEALDARGNVIARSKTAHVITAKTMGKKYANVTRITAGASSVTLAAGRSTKVGATVKTPKKKKPLNNRHAATLRFVTDNPSVATVDAAGNVKALRPGSCNIYIQAVNGMWCKTTVNVR